MEKNKTYKVESAWYKEHQLQNEYSRRLETYYSMQGFSPDVSDPKTIDLFEEFIPKTKQLVFSTENSARDFIVTKLTKKAENGELPFFFDDEFKRSELANYLIFYYLVNASVTFGTDDDKAYKQISDAAIKANIVRIVEEES